MKNKFQSLEELKSQFKEIKKINNFKVKEILFSEFRHWSFKNGNIEHDSGKFFKIEGICVNTNFENLNTWDQPIINQAEIGILGILSKVFDGTRYFLLQAKMEPGNINILQLSPTTQATKSNFSRVHKGNTPAYLEYFLDETKGKRIVDQLQSEQGGKFLKKRNRNIIIEVNEEVDILDNFFWLTMTDIKELLKIDNFVNMDARSVISTFPLIDEEYIDNNIVQNLKSWVIDKKVQYELEIEKIYLQSLKNWRINEESIYNQNDRYFSVIAVEVEAGTREVTSWTQPMIKDLNIGLTGLIRNKIGGVFHYLLQTKVMPGNIDIIDLSPTISISNYKYFIDKKAPLFFNYFINPKNIIYDVLQSEEGGRFYHMQNKNMIIDVDEDFDIPDNFRWLTYSQIMTFMPLGMINIETRSLISAL